MEATQSAPRSERLHLVFFGRCNSGKSSLINALTGQQTSVVSEQRGTTTDPVVKAMEIHGLGACVLIDTPGFDDEGSLGTLRTERTREMVARADIAVMVIEGGVTAEDAEWLKMLRERKIPTVVAVSKSDLHPDSDIKALAAATGCECIATSAAKGEGMEALRRALIRLIPEDFAQPEITAGLVGRGDMVVLVMPQNPQAPKGRLILPQVQTLRELLDKGCRALCCTPENLAATLEALKEPPRLIITDSQAFGEVWSLKPAASALTSFSVLFARYKGDARAFTEGAAAIDRLTPQSRVLIAEACTHAPLSEDIGREKIPAMLRRRVGKELQVDIVAGADFPADLTPYDLVIHCGACMFNRRHVLSRVEQAKSQSVPITNYGIALAYLQGILDKIEY